MDEEQIDEKQQDLSSTKELNEFSGKIDKYFSYLDILGTKIIGSLWPTVYASIQDAIAVIIIFQIPGFIGKLTVGNDFSSLNSCLEYGWLSVNLYACSIIVAANFAMWITIGIRFLGRFLKELANFNK